MVRSVLSGGGILPFAGPPQYPAYYPGAPAFPGAAGGSYAPPAAALFAGYAPPAAVDAEQAYVNAEVAAGRIVAIIANHRPALPPDPCLLSHL